MSRSSWSRRWAGTWVLLPGLPAGRCYACRDLAHRPTARASAAHASGVLWGVPGATQLPARRHHADAPPAREGGRHPRRRGATVELDAAAHARLCPAARGCQCCPGQFARWRGTPAWGSIPSWGS